MPVVSPGKDVRPRSLGVCMTEERGIGRVSATIRATQRLAPPPLPPALDASAPTRNVRRIPDGARCFLPVAAAPLPPSLRAPPDVRDIRFRRAGQNERGKG